MLIRILAVIVVIAALVLGLWWYENRVREMVEPEPEIVQPAPSPDPRHPLPAPEPVRQPEPLAEANDEPVPPPRPLPVMDESDEPILEDLSANLDQEFVSNWVVTDRLVERTVVFVNSLDGPAIPARLRPLRQIPGAPSILDDNERIGWSPANAARYNGLIQAIRESDPAEMRELYLHYYPLLQQAHAELGGSEEYFNDRLVDIIDHLLETPEVPEEFEIERWEAHYRFADPAWEEQSWGRKALMRMGPENAALVKDWLRQLREQIAAQNAES